MSLGNFVNWRTPIKHSQEMSGADGSALLDDVLGNVLRRAGDELIVAKREPAGGGWRVGYARAQAFVLGHKALQAIGYGLRVEARLVASRRHRHTPSQRKALRASVIAGDVCFLSIGIEDTLDHLR